MQTIQPPHLSLHSVTLHPVWEIQTRGARGNGVRKKETWNENVSLGHGKENQEIDVKNEQQRGREGVREAGRNEKTSQGSNQFNKNHQ